LYNYYILPYYRKISIFIKDEHEENISEFFTNEIFEMKRKLYVLYNYDPDIFKKMAYSKIAEDKLKKEKIKFVIMPKFSYVIFFSESYFLR
jgi:hypothetical protein